MAQGREAATVRQAILVVLLVSAAFLGGAFVNGPGLSWAQTRVLRSLGLGDGGEIASVDLGATANPDAVSDGSARTKPDGERMRGPVAPVPSLVTEGESSEQDAPDRRSVPKPRPKSKPGRDGGSPPAQPAISPSAKSETALAASPSRRQAAPLDPSITPAVAESAPELAYEPASALPPSPSPLERKIAPAILDTLADLLPSKPPKSSDPSSSSLSSPSSPVAPKSGVEGGDDWAIVQRKMQTLGVSRFTIDGDPGGRVVFSCLIPLAGRQAVSQRFEAEGDDVVGAAQAALRRVALWRATQP
jgi:hypothetical protein